MTMRRTLRPCGSRCRAPVGASVRGAPVVALTLWISAFGAFVPAVASGQTRGNTPADAERDRQARFHFEQGVALYQDGAFDAALAEFRTSYDIRPHPRVLYNIGVVQHALNRYADALASLRRYLADTEDSETSPERRAAVRSLVAEIEALLGSLTIETVPEGADLLVDGELIGRTPLAAPLRLPSGRHEIEVRHDGYRTHAEALEVRSQTELERRIELERLPPPPIHRRWWFWTTIGIVAAGVAVAIVVPLVVPPDEADFGTLRLATE